MATSGHGSQLKKTGTGGYTLSTTGTGGNFDISVAGTGPLEGLLLYVVNSADNTKTGKFNIADPAFQPCSGDPSAVTHTAKTVKKLPLKFSWSGAKTGSVTVRAIVVEKAKACVVELMLKKQNIKARSFAKTVGGFGIAK
nr:3644_t:CDS:2 [Entrophospora candida]